MEIVALLVDTVVQMSSLQSRRYLTGGGNLPIHYHFVSAARDLSNAGADVLQYRLHRTRHGVQLDDRLVGVKFALYLHQVEDDGAWEKYRGQAQILGHR